MRRQLLFIINNLECGGAEKALISLLESIDYDKYDVDLFLFKHQGLFFNSIPLKVQLLELPKEYKYYDMPLKTVLTDCLRNGKLGAFILRMCMGYVFRSERNQAVCDQRAWKFISRSLKNVNRKYDVAIAYLERNPIYFCVDKVKAAKKIGFIHNDYDKLGMDPGLDRSYFSRLDHIVTVSDQCATVLKQRFPEFKHKVEVMYNIVSPKMIYNLSLDKTGLAKNTINLVSVGRLVYQKGFDMAVEACKQLIQSGYIVTWHIIGEGEDRVMLEKKIEEYSLQVNFQLLGIRENPYPYIREADIYVQPSRFEGKSIALDEAKILHKPIVVTDYSTVKDQITNEVNGLVVEMDSVAVFQGIKRLLDDELLRKKLIHNLAQEDLGTESEMDKLYALVQ